MKARTQLEELEIVKTKYKALIVQFPKLSPGAVKSPFELLLNDLNDLESREITRLKSGWKDWKKKHEEILTASEKNYPGLKEILDEFNPGKKEQLTASITWPPVTQDSNEKLMPEELIEVFHKLKTEQERVRKERDHLKGKGVQFNIAELRVQAIQKCCEKLLYGPASPTTAQLKQELSNLRDKMTSTTKHKIKFGARLSISMQSIFGKWTGKVTGHKKIGEIIDFVEKSKVAVSSSSQTNKRT